MQLEYYQIFKNRHPLSGQVFETRKQARDTLALIHQMQVDHATSLGFKVTKRITTVPSLLALRAEYEDGHTESINFTIRKVKLQPVFS